jgi:hypothetical protein
METVNLYTSSDTLCIELPKIFVDNFPMQGCCYDYISSSEDINLAVFNSECGEWETFDNKNIKHKESLREEVSDMGDWSEEDLSFTFENKIRLIWLLTTDYIDSNLGD